MIRKGGTKGNRRRLAKRSEAAKILTASKEHIRHSFPKVTRASQETAGNETASLPSGTSNVCGIVSTDDVSWRLRRLGNPSTAMCCDLRWGPWEAGQRMPRADAAPGKPTGWHAIYYTALLRAGCGRGTDGPSGRDQGRASPGHGKSQAVGSTRSSSRRFRRIPRASSQGGVPTSLAPWPHGKLAASLRHAEIWAHRAGMRTHNTPRIWPHPHRPDWRSEVQTLGCGTVISKRTARPSTSDRKTLLQV